MQEAAVLGRFADGDCLCMNNYTCIFWGMWLPSWVCFAMDLCDRGPVKLGFQCIKFFLWHIRISYSHWRVRLGWHDSSTLEASSKDLCWILWSSRASGQRQLACCLYCLTRVWCEISQFIYLDHSDQHLCPQLCHHSPLLFGKFYIPKT